MRKSIANCVGVAMPKASLIRSQLAAVLLLSTVAFGQENSSGAPEYEVGDEIVIVAQTKLRLPDEAVKDIGRGLTFTVRQVNGRWLWVRRVDTSGWLDSDYVVPVKDGIAHFSKVIRNAPGDTGAFLARANLWSSKGEHEIALADCVKALHLNPGEASGYHQRGLAYYRKGEFSKALEDLNEALQRKTDEASFEVRAAIQRRLGNHDAAISDYDRAVAIAPNYNDAWFGRGRSLAVQDRYDEAIESMSKAIEIDPTQAVYFEGRSAAWTAKNEFERAIEDITHAIQLEPTKAFVYHSRGCLWLEKTDLDRAIADFTRALELDPKSAYSFAQRGEARAKQNNLQEARFDLSEAISLRPNDAWLYSKRAFVHYLSRRYDAAVEDCNKAIDLDPKLANAFNVRAIVERATGRFDEALEDFGRVLASQPNDPALLANRASVLTEMRQYDQALADCDRALAVVPKSRPVRVQRACVLYSQGEYIAAVAECDQVIVDDSEYAGAYIRRGLCWLKIKNYDKALDDFNRVTKLLPEKAVGHYGLAETFLSRGDYPRAVAACNLAYQVESSSPLPLIARARIWATCPDARFRDGKKAVQAAQLAAAKFGWSGPNVLETLASAHAECGDFETALRLQRKAVQLVSRGKEAEANEKLALFEAGKPYRIAGDQLLTMRK